MPKQPSKTTIPGKSTIPVKTTIPNKTTIPGNTTVPSVVVTETKKPKVVTVPPSIAGKWTNSKKHMLYLFKSSDRNVYFLAEEKTVTPSWSLVGRAIPKPNGVYRFEYGYVSGLSNTGFGDWILSQKLQGNFMNARDVKEWNKYTGALVRNKSDYKPPAPTGRVSVGVASARLTFPGIYTNNHREMMWQLNNDGDKVYLLGEKVSGELQCIGMGTRRRDTSKKDETYLLDINLIDVTKPDSKPILYKFKVDKMGITYLNSSDCYSLPPEDRVATAPPVICRNGMVSGVSHRMIKLNDYDRNRTSNVAENIKKNKPYFEYTPTASPNEDPRLSENNDKDGDGHGAIGSYRCSECDDCDDNDPNRFPGNPEVADPQNHDEDCNPNTIGRMDRDRDGHTDYNVYNKDTNGVIIARGDDCNDNDPNIYEGRTETCDGKDNDCDGEVDEGVSQKYYRDEDRDGFGDPVANRGTMACHRPAGYVDNNEDCDDSDNNKTTNCQ